MNKKNKAPEIRYGPPPDSILEARKRAKARRALAVDPTNKRRTMKSPNEKITHHTQYYDPEDKEWWDLSEFTNPEHCKRSVELWREKSPQFDCRGVSRATKVVETILVKGLDPSH